MLNYFRSCDVFCEDMDMPEDAQPEKIPIYKSLINTLLENDIIINDLMYTPEHMKVIESVEGMTESTVTLLHLLYDIVTSDGCFLMVINNLKEVCVCFMSLKIRQKMN